jgi:hypothetical protein
MGIATLADGIRRAVWGASQYFSMAVLCWRESTWLSLGLLMPHAASPPDGDAAPQQLKAIGKLGQYFACLETIPLSDYVVPPQ